MEAQRRHKYSFIYQANSPLKDFFLSIFFIVSCIFCENRLDNDQPVVILGQKGCETINSISEKLNLSTNVTPQQAVHRDCRRNFCRQKEFRRSQHIGNLSEEYRRLRSEEDGFDFEKHCLFCQQNAKLSGNKRGFEVFPVRTFDFQNTVKEICLKRNDAWGNQVLARLEYALDLPAADAIYHQTCNVNFRTGKYIPVSKQKDESPSSKFSRGRPENQTQLTAFLKVAKFLQENDDEQITIGDLVKQMDDLCPGDAYSSTYMKKKLLEYFKDQIIVTELNGIPNVVTFKATASTILNEFYNHPKNQDENETKMYIIKAAAKLIQSDIKDLPVCKDKYPSPHDLSSVQGQLDYLPQSLKTFLSLMCPPKTNSVKIASLGQSIMQAVRPKVSLSPILLGLAVQLHNQFSSRFLIDTLNKFGFCSNYKEVMRFECSAAVGNSAHISKLNEKQSVQFVADNVDHNIRTLDGHNTFHGMGIIATVTPGLSEESKLERLTVSPDLLLASGRINIKFYKSSKEQPSLKFKCLIHKPVVDKTDNLELMLKVIRPIKSTCPVWSGFMQTVQSGSFPGQSSINFLPMIDLNPGDLSCIYSTLHYVCEQAERHQITPIVTFDQPLYWKASIIIEREKEDSPLKNIVLRLGGFHLQMSFLGSVGHLMQSSGLQDAMETVYATNAVQHMFSGKAISRAVRGHLLVDSALNMLIVSDVYGLSVTPQDSELGDIQDHVDKDVDVIASLYDQLLSKAIGVEDISNHPVFDNVRSKLERHKRELLQYPTAGMWIQYMETVDILRRFIKAERTGDWELHLKTVADMLPYLAATGHNLYVKSAYLYLQQMYELPSNHPKVYAEFMDGHHVVRRSDRFWAGLSTDLTIEQTLMRSLKSTGGMTRGKGMTETQRVQWLLAMPMCAAVNSSMQTLTEISFSSSEQHKEMFGSRQKRDREDLITVFDFLEARNPFEKINMLRNIETGVTAKDNVNVHLAKTVGEEIIENIKDQSVMDLSFRKKKQVITMDQHSLLKIENETVRVSTQLLFQRLLVAAAGVTEDMHQVFSYELSSVPSALFDNSGCMREAHKSTLADAIWSLGDCSADERTDADMKYVVDGGSLLHQLPWSRGLTFSEICQLYANYVNTRYGSPTIVFDGYMAGPSTKDVTHQRRSKGIMSTTVLFTGDMPFRSKKDHFLANSQNKQSFIDMLSLTLGSIGCRIIHAKSDADVLMVKTAVESTQNFPTTLIGEDTDLLILLCYYTIPNSHELQFRSGKSTGLIHKAKVWSMKKTIDVVGRQICSILPAVHALTGCDTTSRIFGVGKANVFKKVRTSVCLQGEFDKFQKCLSSDDVARIGENIIVKLYNGSKDENLNQLRYRLFKEKSICNTSTVEIHTLPPTSSAAKFHCMRAFLQIKDWTSDSVMDATVWGWKVENGLYLPTQIDIDPAPSAILSIIRCKCKVNCDSKRCSCRKHGLECSISCKECKGLSCSNSPAIDFSVD
ncbi:hypothetical protein SNE40_008194 [Patella caerulea]|uniref:Tesmin/TSO1-like CXC domain-containing protein n=1 Tax=Patella caerulea TaxID=87958 RepID=A0AAN8PYJ8_PATCE